MTINEKLNEFLYTYAQREAFKSGANWMLEKACEYMKNQYPAHYQDYQEWIELADEYVKQFKKAMEE